LFPDCSLNVQAKRTLDEQNKTNGFMVIRPDSGDPVEAVLEGLQKAEVAFGVELNKKGYKVLKNCSVIQGDGINIHMLSNIIDAVIKAGYSVQSVAFGMGGGLLQKVNRDTMSFATKLSHIHIKGQDTGRDIMKAPKTDLGKFSLPGILQVYKMK
jgi:nicotinic acid phosphoribosyltransferase